MIFVGEPRHAHRNADRSTRRVWRSRLSAVVMAIALPSAPTRAMAQPANEGPLVLRLPSSARFLAIGNAGLVSTDGDAMFYNPGMLASSRGAAGSLQRYGSNGTAGAIATTTTAGSMTIGVGAQFVRFNAPTNRPYSSLLKPGATTLSEPGTVPAASTAFTVGFAKTIKGFRLGANAKYVEDRVGMSADGTLAFDLGMNRALGPGTLGLVVQNLGAGLRIEGNRGTLPRRIGAGWSASRPISEHWDLAGHTALTLEGDLFVRPAGGGELAYVPVEGVALTVRQGFRRPREKDESFFTAGLGVTIDRIALDYAFEPVRGGRDAGHRVGVRVR